MSINYGKLDFASSFSPSSAFPLDARSYFESYDSALAAAKTAEEAGSSNTVYYYGEILTVVNTSTKKSELYIITPEKTLEKVGSNSSTSGSGIHGEIRGEFNAGGANLDTIPAGSKIYEITINITTPSTDEFTTFEVGYGDETIISFIDDGISTVSGSYSYDVDISITTESQIYLLCNSTTIAGSCIVKYTMN